MEAKERVWPRSVAMNDREWEELQRRAWEKRISASRYIRDCVRAAMDKEDRANGG